MGHRQINPDTLAPAIGFAYGVASAPGQIIWLAGQNGHDAAGVIVAPGDLVAQFDQALANIVAVVRAAGGEPEDIVKLNLYVTDVAAYRESRKALGVAHRRCLGRHYPAMMLLGVTGFFDAQALIEIDGVAVIPERREE